MKKQYVVFLRQTYRVLFNQHVSELDLNPTEHAFIIKEKQMTERPINIKISNCYYHLIFITAFRVHCVAELNTSFYELYYLLI